jgi:selenide, water dikinase
LDSLLSKLPETRGPNLLVGFETADDAAVYALPNNQAIISTADFITPIVDDPRTFGRLAAANSLSDVYAMGGRPFMALNLCGYPQDELPPEVIGEIFIGAAEKCKEADTALAGGHTVRDVEVKFGLSVTGMVDQDKLLRNSTARPGDLLVLTKPLGTGALAAAFKKGVLKDDSSEYEALIRTMTSLNLAGADAADHGATAATDITGFGLSGHALEMARGSGLKFTIRTAALPLLPEAVELCRDGFTCGGTKANDGYTRSAISYDASLTEGMIGLLNDPQTSGGLLFSVPQERVADLQAHIRSTGSLSAEIIGEATLRLKDESFIFFN